MEPEIKQLCGIIRETAYSLHCFLKHGHLEKVYENGLANRLRQAGLKVVTQHPLQVFDQYGTVLGDYVADMFIEDRMIAEIKAVKKLADEHTTQLFGYMRACRIEHGILINFGSPRIEIHKYILTSPHDGNLNLQ